MRDKLCIPLKSHVFLMALVKLAIVSHTALYQKSELLLLKIMMPTSKPLLLQFRSVKTVNSAGTRAEKLSDGKKNLRRKDREEE